MWQSHACTSTQALLHSHTPSLTSTPCLNLSEINYQENLNEYTTFFLLNTLFTSLHRFITKKQSQKDNVRQNDPCWVSWSASSCHTPVTARLKVKHTACISLHRWIVEVPSSTVKQSVLTRFIYQQPDQ